MWGKSKFNIYEEENKVRNNFSRLIHTLQHFPSKRSGLDTTSLWNLIEDLESFNPDRKTRSMQFTQTTERKTYSKKCLNLQISSENKKSFVPGSCQTNQKFKNGGSGQKVFDCSPGNKFNQFKEKDFQKPKMTNIYSCGLNKGKDKSLSNNVGINKNNKTLKNVEVRGKNLERSNLSKQSSFLKGKQQHSEKIMTHNKNKSTSLKDPVKTIGKNVNLSTSNQRWKADHNSKERNYRQNVSSKNKIEAERYYTRPNKPNRTQMVNFKSKSNQCTPKSNKALQKIIMGNSQSSMDKCSVVKKLTSYWNNLLNNEFEQCSSITESSGGSFHNVQSLDHLTKGAFNKSETPSENSSLTLKSRHLSESNINIMKRVEDLDSKKFIDTAHNSRSKPPMTTKNTRPVSVSNNNSIKITNKDNCQMLNPKRPCDFKESTTVTKINQFSLISTKEIIEELQTILNILKSFPNCNILSDEILLPQNLTKKMLYIMVASSMVKSPDVTFLNTLEVHADKMINKIEQIKQDINKSHNKVRKPVTRELTNDIPVDHILSELNNNLEIEMQYIFKDNYGKRSRDKYTQIQKKSPVSKCCKAGEPINTIDVFTSHNCKTRLDSENALVISRINMNKVKNALKLFMMWREYFIYSGYNHGNFDFSNYDRPPFHSFTVIFEEDIFIEEERSDEDDSTQYDSEDERVTYMDMYRSAASEIEKYINRVIDILENYWPDSPEIFVRIIYQALVSILIWWVIVKEVLVK